MKKVEISREDRRRIELECASYRDQLEEAGTFQEAEIESQVVDFSLI